MKRITILTLLVFATVLVNAQSFGVRGGVNFSNMIRTGDDDADTEFKTGFHAGVTMDIPLVDRLSFAPEVMYSQKGYKTSRSGLLGGDNTFTVNTNFIEIPILLKIKAASGFNIHLGPQISFLTSTTTTFDNGSDAYKRTVNEENEKLRKNLIGGVLGVGFDLSKKASLVARYALDLQKNDENGSEIPEYKNQVIQLGIGLKL
ncbi:MAG: PorT family protein [Pyrinomonadaceae bacterium]|nr:PorT family protein [Sphingobacteriaceae bacterium]